MVEGSREEQRGENATERPPERYLRPNNGRNVQRCPRLRQLEKTGGDGGRGGSGPWRLGTESVVAHGDTMQKEG